MNECIIVLLLFLLHNKDKRLHMLFIRLVRTALLLANVLDIALRLRDMQQ